MIQIDVSSPNLESKGFDMLALVIPVLIVAYVVLLSYVFYIFKG